MIRIGTGLIEFETSWTTLKSFILQKGLAVQYENDTVNTWYVIFALDGTIVYRTVIFQGTIPPSSDTTQGQNDSDKADFETNFKPFANKPTANQTALIIDGYVTTTGATNTALMASAYAEQTTNAQRSLVSSDATDTSAGTGARQVMITYYDQTMLGPFTETVTLNGTTPVNTVAANICFIEKMNVVAVGSNGGNAGTISLKAATAGGGATIGTIVVGDNETNWCHHYVGPNTTMQLVEVRASSKNTVYSGNLKVRQFFPTLTTKPDRTLTPALRIPPGEEKAQAYRVPIAVTGPSKVVLYVQSDGATGTTDWSGGIEYFEA